jgi:hypothetical protein
LRNPFGPFLNQIFHSPWFPQESGRDRRFLPVGLWQALVYPLLWARRSEGLVTESPLADPRFAIGLIALFIAAASEMWRHLAKRRLDTKQGNTLPESAAARRTEWAVMVFILAGYAVWLVTFGILRYAVPTEVLLGFPIWAAARVVLLPALSVFQSLNGLTMKPPAVRWSERTAAAWTIAIALGICASVTLYPNWGRQPFNWTREPHGTAAVAVAHAILPEGSLVAMVGPAISFTAPFLVAPGVRFIGVPHPGEVGGAAFHTLMAEAIRNVVRSHQGPIFAVVEDPDDYDRDIAKAYGIDLDLTSCAELPNNLTTLVRLCRCR